ncbi:hypothetical protein D3C75_259050 [compost metagenome]
MFNYFRNKKIRRIFSRFPNIDNVDRVWLIEDLKVREDRLRDGLLLSLNRPIESSLIADRIVLIDEAINIMKTDAYRDYYKCMTVKKVYAAILK